ncbi:MAG: TRAP transporter large permease [Rhodospirillaceae bacterium]|nr:TRAP transporter large permease [Rhodospirillaceae bacterium]
MLTLVIVLGCLILLLLTGVPVFAGLGIASVVIMLLVEGSFSGIADTVFGKLNINLLATIPLFAFMAYIMIRARIVDDLYQTAHTLVRHLPGGLGVATVMSCTVFSAISGSSAATALTIGTSAIPQMNKFGYPTKAALGVVAAGGTLGILIPPSGPMILYAIVTEASIGALFAAGLLPGLIIASLFALWCVVSNLGARGAARAPRATWREALVAIRTSFWALVMPPLVLGGIYFGIFTASEAAAIGAILALVVAILAYRNFGWKDLFDCAYDTVRISAMLFMIVAAAGMFGHAVTIMRLPNELVDAIAGAGLTKIQFVIAVMLVILVLGMFLETIAIILITTPIIFPVIQDLGVNPVWYGVLLMINLELALITPPVGINLFVIRGITRAPLGKVIRGTVPYAVLMVMSLILMLLVPQISLWLPSLMGFGR